MSELSLGPGNMEHTMPPPNQEPTGGGDTLRDADTTAAFDPNQMMEMADMFNKQRRFGRFRAEIGKHGEVATRPELPAWLAAQDSQGQWVTPVQIDTAPPLQPQAPPAKRGFLGRRADRVVDRTTSESGAIHKLTGRAEKAAKANSQQRLKGHPISEQDAAALDAHIEGRSRAEMRTDRHNRVARTLGGQAVRRFGDAEKRATTAEIVGHFQANGAVDPAMIATFRADFRDTLLSFMGDYQAHAEAAGRTIDVERLMVQMSKPLYREMQARLFGTTRDGIEHRYEVPRPIIEQFDTIFMGMEDRNEPDPDPTQEMPTTPAPEPEPAPSTLVPTVPTTSTPMPWVPNTPPTDNAQNAQPNPDTEAGRAAGEAANKINAMKQDIRDEAQILEEEFLAAGIDQNHVRKKVIRRLLGKYHPDQVEGRGGNSKDPALDHERVVFITSDLFKADLNIKQGTYQSNGSRRDGSRV